MKLHHIVDENGKSDTHWYADMQVSDDMTIRNILIDTGASISTLNIKSLSRIYEKSEKDVREYLLASGITDKIVIMYNETM